MMNWERFNRSNACPICNGERKDCRRNTVKNLIHCRSAVEPPTGWKFVKEDSEGFGIFAPRRDNWNPEQWQAYRSKQVHLKKIADKNEVERQSKALKPQIRDKYYRQLLASLPLHPADQADLLGRGLTNEQIAAWGFKSVGSWQRLDQKFPIALPGLNIDGISLNTPKDGYLCPIPDINDRIVGAQLRLRNPGKDEHRYLWLTSANKRNPNGQTPHVSGELPLGVYRPIGKPLGIALVEGLGVKPRIASVQGWIVIGAAGGNWLSAEKQFKAYLERLSAEAGTKLITLFPDAGDVENVQVCQRWERAIAKVIQWGYSIQVGWWEQVTKLENDIDEITPEQLKAIRYLTPKQFKALYQVDENEFLTPKERWELETKQNPFSEFAALPIEPSKKDRFRAETERIQAELNSLRIEPTITATGRYIPQGLLQLPDKPGIILVDGTMGVGKTSTALKELVRQHRARHPKALEWLFTPRNLLGIQSGAILGLPHHSYSTSYPFQSSSCFESVGAIALDQLPDGAPLILCDEAGQSFKQILDGGTCKDSQPFVLEHIQQLFRIVAERGGWIVLSEDGLTNLELDFVKDASGLEVVEHLKFTKEVITPRTFEIYDHASLTWDEMLIRLDQGENLLSFADSRKWLEETERMLAEREVERCFFIHSGNSQEEWVRDLMKNPTAWVEQNKPRFLGFTPSMGSGISIDDPDGHFAAMAIHITHLEPREAKQGCDRLRTDVPRFGYVKERGASDDDLFSGSRPDLILRDLRRNKNGIAKLTQFAEYAESKGADLLAALQRIDQDWDNPDSELSFYLKHWSRYKARENYSKLALRENLISIWESQGHTVNLLQLGKVKHLAEERTEHRAVLDQEEAIAWAAADTSDTSLNEARDILNRLGATPERRRVARKRLMEDKLPGTNLDTAEFCLKAVIQQNGRFLKSAEMLWKVKNPDAAKQIDRWNWSNAFSQSAQTGRIVILHRLSNNSAQAKLLHECPLQPFINGKVKQYNNNTTEAIAVHQWALLHNRQFRRHLRINISESHTPVQTVNKLLRKLGFEVDNVGWKGSREERQRQYQISNLQDCDRDAILKALTERFISRCEDKGETPVIATRIEDLTPTSCDHHLEQWFTSECLEDVRLMWIQAESEEVRAEIRRFVPMTVLKRAIS